MTLLKITISNDDDDDDGLKDPALYDDHCSRKGKEMMFIPFSHVVPSGKSLTPVGQAQERPRTFNKHK